MGWRLLWSWGPAGGCWGEMRPAGRCRLGVQGQLRCSVPMSHGATETLGVVSHGGGARPMGWQGMGVHRAVLGARPAAPTLACLLASPPVPLLSRAHGELPRGRASVYPHSSCIIPVSGHPGLLGLGRERVAEQTGQPGRRTPRRGVMPWPRRLAWLVVCRRVCCSASSSSLCLRCLRCLCCLPSPLPRRFAALVPCVVPRPQ